MQNQSEIKIKRIEIWTHRIDQVGVLTAIQVHLSNGQSSPQFKTDTNAIHHWGSLEIDSQIEVRKYAFAHNSAVITGIRLFKEDGSTIKEWQSTSDPKNW